MADRSAATSVSAKLTHHQKSGADLVSFSARVVQALPGAEGSVMIEAGHKLAPRELRLKIPQVMQAAVMHRADAVEALALPVRMRRKSLDAAWRTQGDSFSEIAEIHRVAMSPGAKFWPSKNRRPVLCHRNWRRHRTSRLVNISQSFCAHESAVTCSRMFATALVFLTVVGFTMAAVLAFAWAARSGQFHDAGRGARAVFDPDEPEGIATDAFPGEAPPVISRSSRTTRS
jgi:cbb3-type cytochrome oxidase maturation protein